jgi:gliding motility-associated lipoprotein GldD
MRILRPEVLPVVLIALLLGMGSCNPSPMPKPKAYPRVHYPERGGYTVFEAPDCPFRFELPDYYLPERKDDFFGDPAEHPCWGYNLNIPALNGTIYLTYKELGPDQKLDKLSEEAYRLTFKHARKADFIEPIQIATDNGAFGLLYAVGGDAASPLQFFVTDTVQHFLRGTLNFRSRPNADSLAPVVRFVSEDLNHMLMGLVWK